MSIKKNFPNHSLPPLFDRATLCSIAHCWSPLAVFLCGLWVLATATVHCIIVRFPTDMNVSCICILSPQPPKSHILYLCELWVFKAAWVVFCILSPKPPSSLTFYSRGPKTPFFALFFAQSFLSLNYSTLQSLSSSSSCRFHSKDILKRQTFLVFLQFYLITSEDIEDTDKN